MTEGKIVVRVVCWWGCYAGFVSVYHVYIAVRAVVDAVEGGAVRWSRGILGGYRVEELGALGVRSYYCYFVAVVEGEVGIDEDEDVGDGCGKW